MLARMVLIWSRDLPASASQSAGIMDVSHCAWLVIPFFLFSLTRDLAENQFFVSLPKNQFLVSLIFPPINIIIIFRDSVSLCCPGWRTVAWSPLTASSTASWVHAILLPQPPKYLGLQACTTTPDIYIIYMCVCVCVCVYLCHLSVYFIEFFMPKGSCQKCHEEWQEQ